MLVFIASFLFLSFITSLLLVVACMRSSQLNNTNGMPDTEVFVSAERHQEGELPLVASHR